MKKKILTALIGLIACTTNAQQALTIIEQDYELAKRTATQQHKLLIVDFYTTWCAPCKMLDKTIFHNDSIASEISKNFIVLRYDAEKDMIHNLSLKHHIASYPTTIVLTANGKLIRKMYGTGGGAGTLVASYSNLLCESISLNKQGKYITGFQPAIDTALYPDFYKKYVRRIADIRPGDLENYWNNNKDLLAEVSFDILAYFGRAPKHVVDFFIQHKPDYEAKFGKEDVKFVMDNLTGEKFSTAVEEKDEEKYEAAVKFARQHLTTRDADEYIKTYELEMDIAMNRWDKAIGIVSERINSKKINENGINSFCWSIYEKCNKQPIIGQSIQFMKDVVEANPSFATLDTYARLLAKNGRKDEAKAAMKKAIEIAKATGEDTKESEEALSTW